jgi:hypothetical protein
MIAAGLVAVSPAASSTPQKITVTVPASFAQVLTTSLQFSASDVASLGRGSTVVKSLQAAESREVPVAGAIWFNVPVEYFLARARDIAVFKRGEEVQQIGVFGPRATPDDLRGLTLDPQDIEDLRKCRLGQCKVKLDLRGLERFRYEIGWSTPDAADQANRLARDVVAAYVAAYQQSGDAALIEYRDREVAVSVAAGAKALLGRVPWLKEAAPGLLEYIAAFPGDAPPQVEDVVYWSKEAFGMKPMVSATHMMVWRGPGGAADATILSKQIFATHYLEASLGVTLLARDGRPDPAGVFVVYLNRSLVDLLQGGLLGPFRRSVARSKTKEGLGDHLEALKKRIEAEYKAGKS